MKSLSQFLISEELPVDDIEGRTKAGRVEKKYKKKTRKTLSTADRARLDAARLAEIEKDAIGKRGEEIRKSVVKSQGQDDLLDTINKNRERPVKKGEKFYGKPTGVDVKTGKAKYVPPKEIEGRKQYLDPKTNKASEKGIKNYISKARQMPKQTNIPVDSKTTDNIAKIAKTEYTDKINQKYGGRRAKRARSNAPSLADVQKEINKKEYAKNLKKQRTSDFRKFSAKAEKLAKETARRSAETTRSDAFNRLYGTDGGYGDSNTGSGASTQSKGSQTPKTPKTPKIEDPWKSSKSSTTATKTGTVIGSRKVTPDWEKVKDGVKSKTKFKPPTPPSPSKLKSFKDFSKNAFKSKALKTSLKVAKGTSKALPVVTGTLNAIGNYKAARAQGRGKLGSAVKSAVTTTAYGLGALGGGTLGTAGGAITGPGALVTGTAGAIVGGSTASSLATKAYDAVFKPPTKKKVKTKPNTNSPGVVGGGGKKGGYKWKPTGIAIES